MERRAWWATVHGVKKSRTRLKWLSTHTHISNHYVIHLKLIQCFMSIISQWKKVGEAFEHRYTHTQEPMWQMEAEIRLIHLHAKENSGRLATTTSQEEARRYFIHSLRGAWLCRHLDFRRLSLQNCEIINFRCKLRSLWYYVTDAPANEYTYFLLQTAWKWSESEKWSCSVMSDSLQPHGL